jgi:hypothetical protein
MGRGGGGAAELRRVIKGGVDHWSVRHGVEVGGGSAWCGDVRGEAAALGRAQGGRKGVASGQLGHMGHAG